MMRQIHGEWDVDGWNLKLGRGGTLQLGNPSQHIPSWTAHPYRLRIVNAGRELLGDDVNYKYDQLIYKPPGSDVELLWHQDAGYG